MAYDVDREPGAWVTAQAHRRTRQVYAFGAGMILLGIVLFGLAVYRALPLIVAALVVLAALGLRNDLERWVNVQARWTRGAAAERAVGATLNALRPEWIVMHDIERRGANIDHLVSGPHGVFVIETKTRRYDDVHLKRVKGQAAALHDELLTWVTPVIVLHERNREPWHTHGVWIVPHRHLLDWLRAQRNQPAQFARVAHFADTL